MSQSDLRLDPAFLEQHEITKAEVVEQFKSKKNYVAKIRAYKADGSQLELVLKQCGPHKSSLLSEASLQQKLWGRGLTVPQVLYFSEQALVMDFLPGPSLVDYLQQVELEQALTPQAVLEQIRPVAHGLAIWLREFYQLVGGIAGQPLIMGDINLRNFLYVGGSIYGLDFEDCRPGDMMIEAATICAYVLAYKPAFTKWKVAIAQEMLTALATELAIPRRQLHECLQQELQLLLERRGQDASATALKVYLE